MTDGKTPSIWLYVQISLSVIVTGFLAVFFYNLIIAATSNIKIIAIKHIEPLGSMLANVKAYETLMSDKIKSGEPTLIKINKSCEPQKAYFSPHAPICAELKRKSAVLPTITLEKPVDICFKLFLSDFPPSLLAKRIQWYLLVNSNDTWSYLKDHQPNSQTEIRKGIKCLPRQLYGCFSVKIEKPGHYLVVVVLPPLSINDTQSTIKLNSFLSSNLGANCKAYQIIWPGKSLSTQPSNLCSPPSPSPKPIQKDKPKQREDKANNDQTKQKQGQETVEQSGHANADRNISSKVHSKEYSTGSSDNTDTSRQDGRSLNADVVNVPYRKGAKPVTIEDIKKLRMDGKLPEVNYIYEETETGRLSLDGWKFICLKYNIPFVLVPSDTFVEDFPRWPILTAENKTKMMTFENISKEYGVKLISLDDISEDVKEYVKRQFDSKIWDKCNKYRGFLLSDLLVYGIYRALLKNNPPINIGTLEDISKIVFEIKINKPESRKPIVTIVDSKITMK